MKIAVTSTGPTLDDAVEARFGRCPYFLIIDPDTLDLEALPNANIALGGGAGIQSAQTMANQGVSVVLTGNCGPNAFRVFGTAGIQVITGVTGQVRQAVRQFKSGALAAAHAPSVKGHAGMGRGGGKGMGRGQFPSTGTGDSAGAFRGGTESTSASKDDELKRLKEQAETLSKQVEAIESSIKNLEKG